MFTATQPELIRLQDQLPTLENALNHARMKAVLAPLVKEFLGDRLQIQDLDMTILQQRSKRCVIRYHLRTFDPIARETVNWRIIGKVFRPGEGEKVFFNMKQLWDAGFCANDTDCISMPEPLGFSSPLCLLLQREVPGEALRVLLQRSQEPKHFRLLARLLAKLHRCPLAPTKPYHVHDHLMRCHPKHGFLILACPELAEYVDYIVDKAQALELRIGDIACTPLHGDFHLGQVHIENGYAWLIDFDALSYGDPAADLGNLLVFLKQKAAKNDAMNRVIDAFLSEYFSVMDPQIAQRIPLYEALTHLRRACKALRLQQEGWRQRATKMVMKGVASIDEMAKQFRPASKISVA